MKTKFWILCLIAGVTFSACKKDNEPIERIFENGKLNLVNFATSLPQFAKVIVEHPSESSDAYFKVTLSDAGRLDGRYSAWCIQTGEGIKPGRKNSTSVYSSYANLPDYDKTFLNRLNWVINQKYVGQGFTYGEVQIAIWTLMHGYTAFNEDVSIELYNTRPPNPLDPEYIGSWNKEKVNEIVILAAGISDYLPDPGGLIGVLCIVESSQDLAIEFTLPSE
jgi:hypothetical protein